MEEENRIKEQVLAILMFLQFFTAKEAHLSTSKHCFRWSLAASSLIFVLQANHSPSIAMINYVQRCFCKKWPPGLSLRKLSAG